MKNTLLILLFFIVAGLAFGQFSVEVWGDLEPNLLQVMTPTRDSANPQNTNGVPYFGTSRVDLFTGGVFRT